MARHVAAQGLQVRDTWLAPEGPVDATIITGELSLVWDERTGWRIGI
ncbi:hypothetical protein [Spirillospora sp. NPDC048819]